VELLRRHRRGEVTLFELLQHFTPLELVRDSERRMRSQRRRKQSLWLQRTKQDMEDRLAKLGLPRDSWQATWIWDVVNDENGDPLDDMQFGVTSRPTPSQAEWVRLQREEGGTKRALTALWAAGGAWCADAALMIRDPDQRLTIGRYLEACRANLKYPDRLRSEFQQRGRKGGRGKKRGTDFEREGWSQKLDDLRAELGNPSERELARILAEHGYGTEDQVRYFIRARRKSTRTGE